MGQGYTGTTGDMLNSGIFLANQDHPGGPDIANGSDQLPGRKPLAYRACLFSYDKGDFVQSCDLPGIFSLHQGLSDRLSLNWHCQ